MEKETKPCCISMEDLLDEGVFGRLGEMTLIRFHKPNMPLRSIPIWYCPFCRAFLAKPAPAKTQGGKP